MAPTTPLSIVIDPCHILPFFLEETSARNQREQTYDEKATNHFLKICTQQRRYDMMLSLVPLLLVTASLASASGSGSGNLIQEDLKERLATNLTGGTNTYAQAVNYGQTHPTRDGGSWSGWCASLMWRAGNLPESAAAPSAIDGYHRSTIISLDPNSAPSGAFHWWDIGADGHVAMSMGAGNTMMASCKVDESWGDCIGSITVSRYNSKSGARYLGWSYDYCGAEIADVHGGGGGVPQSSTASSGVPDTAYYMRQQLYAKMYGYTGPIDGVLGTNSWKYTQVGLKNYGYTGPTDGVPGTNTYMAMQRLASGWGYTGPIDGELGPNSYRGLAKYFNTL
jgi:hypothetical protein